MLRPKNGKKHAVHPNKKGLFMRMNNIKKVAIAFTMSVMTLSAPAFAQDKTEEKAEQEESGPITVSGGVTVVSDYRFRGVSLSDKDFAVQPTLTITHESGLYAGFWGSNVADNGGDDVEIDLYAGFGGGEAVTYDIGATYYLYPGASDINYVEFIGKVGTTVGPAEIGATVAYAPNQNNIGDEDNFYIGSNLGVGIPTTPITLVATLGLEDGAFGDNKIDWSLGATAEVKGFTVGASYVDTNRFNGGLGEAGVVFSLGYSF
jgi:uncharacterized protein (TIGR02001 family)